MKKSLLLVPIFLAPLFLSGCQNGTWKDYNSPTKFLKMAKNSPNRCNISMYDENKGSEDRDYNLEVYNALIEAGKFIKSGSSASNSQRYFTYYHRYHYGYVGLAPALYCKMSVFDDGFIKIQYETLKEDKFAYYEMDAAKAYAINDLVFEKIPKERAIKEEDKKQAYIDGTVDNFLNAMENKSSIKTVVQEEIPNETGHYVHTFYDNGALLGLLKDLEYVRTAEKSSISQGTFIYNAYDEKDEEISWAYYLDGNGDYVEIYYHYKNRFEEIRSVKISYSIDATKGKEIIAKAIELGKR